MPDINNRTSILLINSLIALYERGLIYSQPYSDGLYFLIIADGINGSV